MRTFLDELSLSCKLSTIGTYVTGLNAFLKSAPRFNSISSHQPTRISPAILQRYLKFLNKRQLAPYTKVNYLLVVKKYLIWEIEHGTITESVIKTFDRSFLPKVPDYLPRPLSHDTDRLLINKMRSSNHPYAPIFLLLRLTGLRISELINLSKNCVVTNARDEHYLKVPLGKMDNERLVPLNQEALALIHKIKKIYPICKRKIDPNRLISVGGHISSVYEHLNNQFKKIVGDTVDQNKPITFHRLRHTYATSLLTGGVGIISIMKLLGHRRIEMSLRYAKVTPTYLRDEYLKALTVLEQQWTSRDEYNFKDQICYVSLPELINMLATFLKKEVSLKTPKQKNLLRRLARLKTSLEKINLDQKFPLTGV